MFAAYLVSLIVGGLFVGMSVVSGLDQDADVDVDGADFDGDLDGDFSLDGDVDVDVDIELDGDVGGDISPSVGDVGMAGQTHADKRKRPQLPFTSFRFWTFGACFFGLTGTLLTTLELTGEPTTALLAGGVGLLVGGVTSTLVRTLREPVSGDVIGRSEYRGVVGELLFPLRPGGTSKMAMQVRHRHREMLCVSDADTVLPKGTRVMVLRVDDDARAHVVLASRELDDSAHPPMTSLDNRETSPSNVTEELTENA